MRNMGKTVLAVLLVLSATALVAQTSYEVKSGTVVAVYNDQLVARLPSGEVKAITVPPGFKFTVDGKQVGLHELQPGTELTAVIKTTTTPETVRTVSIKNGTVLRVMGNQLVVRMADGQQRILDVPKGFEFDLDGKKVNVSQLRPNTKLTAEIVYRSESVSTTREATIGGSTPPPPPAPVVTPAPAPAPAPEPEPEPVAAVLPKTASPLPLVGLLGLLLAAAGVTLRRVR